MEHHFRLPNVILITHPFSSDNVAARQNVRNFVQIFKQSSKKLFVITGNFPEYSSENVKIITLKSWNAEKRNLLLKILLYMILDIQISFNLLKLSKSVNIVVFHIGARVYLLSAVLAKLLRKRVLVFSFNTSSKLSQIISQIKGKSNSSYLAVILEKIIFSLADQIGVESKSVIAFSNISEYRNKIAIYGPKYVDIKTFRIMKNLKDRKTIIGYIGRLSIEKGIANFVDAIPLILNKKRNVHFLIGGDGPLFKLLKTKVEEYGISGNVRFVGWIPDHELPEYLNELKILVLPSYTEGVPGIVQEAMACGAVVLATPVGAIPDLIEDGKTGFIMENNSPECIAQNVIRVLEHPYLEEIVKNARRFIEEKFTYNNIVDKYRRLLNKLWF